MAEMLLQSHGGAIRLLPALPSQWPSGKVAGLRARGGFEVGITWKDGTLVEASLLSAVGGPCRLAWPEAGCGVFLNGESVTLARDAGACLNLATKPGDRVLLRATV